MILRRVRKIVRGLPDPISGPFVRRGLLIDHSRAEGVLFKVADTREELEAAYRLVHEVYVKEGYEDLNKPEMRINLRYALPTTATVVGKVGNQIVITLTIIGDSPFGLPMDMIFSRELCDLRREDRWIAEIGALASHPDFRRRQQAVALYADKAILAYAMSCLEVDDVVIAVNPKHQWVYKHLILFATINNDVRRYRYVNDAPAVAMRLDMTTCLERWRLAYQGKPEEKSFYRFFQLEDADHIDLPKDKASRPVWDEAMFSYFFEHRDDPRREGCGSLKDLYWVLDSLPGSSGAGGRDAVECRAGRPRGKMVAC
jgi:hypothetical protein